MATKRQRAHIRVHTAGIAAEIDRTKQICARSLELLRLPSPSTFLGNKLEPLSENDKRRHLRLEIADDSLGKEPQAK